jgi:hypothetical protein
MSSGLYAVHRQIEEDTMEKPTATTAQVRTIWRSIVSRAYGENLARAQTGVRFASSTGQRPGTTDWYVAAIWKYNQG